MTTKQIHKHLRGAGKPIGVAQLYRLFNRLEIKPLGIARPQNYPDDAPARILKHWGLTPSPAEGRNGGELISVEQLRAAKPQNRKGSK
jgi:hypothetical protein